MEENSNLKALLRKHLKGNLSSEEKLEIIYYFRKNHSFEEFPDVEEILELMDDSAELNDERAKNILDNIFQISTSKNKHVTRKKSNYFLKYAVAAVFIGFCLIAYTTKDYFMPSNYSVFEPESSLVRINIGNEKIRIINEADSSLIEDLFGNVVGQQIGNKIVYNKTEYTDEIQYNTILVPHGKKFELSLADGTRVNLNAGTSLKYPVSFKKGEPREVFLDGEAFFKVAEDKTHSFIVKSQDLSVKVYGTSFNVAAYPEESVLDVVLVDGIVGLYKEKVIDNVDPYLLKPGEMGSFNKEKNQLSSKKVDPVIYTSWIHGELIFRNMKFRNILKKLERQYNYTIVNKNTKLGEEKFNANFGAQPIDEIMESFEKIYGIKYSIKGRKIFIE